MIDFGVTMVDPGRAWGLATESQLRQSLHGPLVRSFPKTDVLLGSLSSFPEHVPLVVIADTAAVCPGPEEGAFAAVRKYVPRCKMVYYSAEPDRNDLYRVLELGGVRLISRSGEQSMDRLREYIEDVFHEFQTSLDYRMIMRFQENMQSTPHPERSGIDGDEDNELAPVRILLEMARGTPKGLRYINHMVPSSRIGPPL